MSQKALRDELMTLLVAGQETSAILLGWACAFLAQHPEVQQRTAKEAQQVRSMYTILGQAIAVHLGTEQLHTPGCVSSFASFVATPHCLSAL